MEIKGIDVSSYQGRISWESIDTNTVKFAMIRATYGSNGVDSQFINNIKGIALTTIYPGAYHYCLAKSTSDAIAEATNFINIISPYKFYYPLAIDIEDDSLINLGKKTITDIIISFCDTLRSKKYYPIIYTNLNWIHNYIDTDRINDIDIWLAQYSGKLTYDKNVTMWQYSQDGKIYGIDTAVDLDISYKDYANIIQKSSLNNVNIANNANASSQNGTYYTFYTVKKGDTLWDISKKFLGDGSKYKEIIKLNNLQDNTIYPGEILRIPSTQNENIKLYRVQRGDTLWKIAQKYLNDGARYKEIMSLNGMTTDLIYPGQILKISV